MPVEFLTDEQAAAYGRYTDPVPRADLEERLRAQVWTTTDGPKDLFDGRARGCEAAGCCCLG